MWGRPPGPCLAESEVEEGRDKLGVVTARPGQDQPSSALKGAEPGDLCLSASLSPSQQGKQGLRAWLQTALYSLALMVLEVGMLEN